MTETQARVVSWLDEIVRLAARIRETVVDDEMQRKAGDQ